MMDANRLAPKLALTTLTGATAVIVYALWVASAGDPSVPSAKLVQRRQAASFDMRRLLIPADQIYHGGPPKDGIPAITNPKTVPADRATFLQPGDRVIGVAIESESRAYPIAILTQHEIVNDVLGGVPTKEFGVSGLLYNSNVLMYDRSDRESLWSQMLMRGVSGPAAGTRLTPLPMELTTWESWRSRHPDTDVMSVETGYGRNYRQNPYLRYFQQPGLMFPVQPRTNVLPLKERVLGVWSDSRSIAIPESYFGGKSGNYSGSLDGLSFEVEYDASDKVLRMRRADEGLSWANSFWFAWYAFHPGTRLVGQ